MANSKNYVFDNKKLRQLIPEGDVVTSIDSNDNIYVGLKDELTTSKAKYLSFVTADSAKQYLLGVPSTTSGQQSKIKSNIYYENDTVFAPKFSGSFIGAGENITNINGANIQNGTVTNVKIASGIDQSKITNLVNDLAGKANTSGTYPNMTVGAATKATNDSNSANISTTYLKIRKLANSDTSYNAKPLSDNASYTVTAPTDGADLIIVQGLLSCANRYWVHLILRRDSFLGYTSDAPTLYWFRSVNGESNTSYGFMSLEASLSGTSLNISGWKINQSTNNYSSSHARASNCYFALHSVYEILNSNL